MVTFPASRRQPISHPVVACAWWTFAMILQRRTVVVEGPLAYRMRRFEAACSGEIGMDIVTISPVGRPVGGRIQPARGRRENKRAIFQRKAAITAA
jgi:hypothetical protein